MGDHSQIGVLIYCVCGVSRIRFDCRHLRATAWPMGLSRLQRTIGSGNSGVADRMGVFRRYKSRFEKTLITCACLTAIVRPHTFAYAAEPVSSPAVYRTTA